MKQLNKDYTPNGQASPLINLCHAAGDHVGQRTQISYLEPGVDVQGGKEKYTIPRDSIWSPCEGNV